MAITAVALVNGARTRLGIADGNKTTVLTIPDYLINGTTFMRFVADPIGGNRITLMRFKVPVGKRDHGAGQSGRCGPASGAR